MPRDVRDFKIQETVTLEGPTGTNTGTPLRQSVRSTRSDIVKTIPMPDGSYGRTTGYHAFFATTSSGPGSVKWRSTVTGSKYKLTWTGGEVSSSVWRAGCSSLLEPNIPTWCISQARAMLASQARGDLDVSVMVGEARETVTGLAGLLHRFWNLLRLFPFEKWRRFVSMTVREVRNYGRLRSAASAYLAWLYGIRPLISDAQRIMDHWDEFTMRPVGKPLYAEVRDSEFQLPAQYGFRYAGTVSRGVSTGAYAHIINPDLVKFSRMGLTSPLSLAWELTTLSFVVDWFLHIGNFIQSWEGTSGVGISNHWETRWVDNSFTQYEDRYKRLYASNQTVLDGVNDEMEVYCRLKAMSRYGSPFLLPAPPYLSWGIRESTAAAAAALTVTRLRNFRKLTYTGAPPVASAL